MDAPASTDLLQRARSIARDDGADGVSGREIDQRTAVVAGLEPTAGRLRLHLTEDTSGERGRVSSRRMRRRMAVPVAEEVGHVHRCRRAAAVVTATHGV
jgi:hypothetical protein